MSEPLLSPLPRALGIESSCDESAVAVLGPHGEIELALLASQAAAHAPHGGVVPELASREHLKALPYLVDRALGSVAKPPELVAVTAGPGLVGALLVGVRFASALAWGLSIPLVAVDHLEGHLASPFLDLSGEPALEMPSSVLALVASGGHSSWFHMKAGLSHLLCRTRDDAAGESFDKIAQALGLGYPGGPVVDRLARRGDSTVVPLPRPRLKDESCDFSFSGLKSATLRWINQHGVHRPIEPATAPQEVCDLLASFEAAVVDQLLGPLPELVARCRPELLTVSGGVAANSLLRQSLDERGRELGVQVLLPHREMTTDNAAMIGRAGQLAWGRGESYDPRRIDARPRVAWQPPGMRAGRSDQMEGRAGSR